MFSRDDEILVRGYDDFKRERTFFESRGYEVTFRSATDYEYIIIQLKDKSKKQVIEDVNAYFEHSPETEKHGYYFKKDLSRLLGIDFETCFEINRRLALKDEIKNGINQLIELYENTGKKFCFFKQSKDREKTINTLLENVSQIINSESINNDSVYERIAEAVNIARVNTRVSHKKGSVFGCITSSRLETYLSNYLTALVSTNKISNDYYETLINRETVSTTNGYRRLS